MQASGSIRVQAVTSQAQIPVEGAVVTFKFKFTWSFKDGSEFSQSTTIAGGSEDGPKDALKIAIENMYNFALSAYLSKLNLGTAN